MSTLTKTLTVTAMALVLGACSTGNGYQSGFNSQAKSPQLDMPIPSAPPPTTTAPDNTGPAK